MNDADRYTYEYSRLQRLTSHYDIRSHSVSKSIIDTCLFYLKIYSSNILKHKK